MIKAINSLPTECQVLIIFANRLDPDQARSNVRSDLDPICLTLRWLTVFLKDFLKKNQQHEKFSGAKEFILLEVFFLSSIKVRGGFNM